MNKALDAYFFDYESALTAARQRNGVELPDKGVGLQICYYHGEPVNDGIENLICVPFDTMADYFMKTLNRQPQFVDYSGTDFSVQKQQEIGEYFNRFFEEINQQRDERKKKYIQLIKNQEPDAKVKKVFFMTSRHTTVIQHSTKGIAKAFEKLGYDVKVLIEENDMQLMYKDLRVKAIYEFNPHLVVNINHMFNDILNDKTWNVVWWQDPMPELMSEDPIHVRNRDLVFSMTDLFFPIWMKKQTSPIYHQDMCVDMDVFYPGDEAARSEKIVFVGSSYIHSFPDNPQINGVRSELIQLVENGATVSPELIRVLSKHYGVKYNYTLINIFQGVVRDTTVRWLCRDSKIPVEVYGADWQDDDVVRPFHKGEIEYGQPLADIYRSAKYAFVVQGGVIQSQRLIEVTSCGAIPVIYDSRPISPDPLWEDHYLFFRSREQLNEALNNEPAGKEPLFEKIKSKFSYEGFAKRINKMIS